MARKVWAVTLMARPEWAARRSTGRADRQVDAMVAARSKAEAAQLLGLSVHALNQYASEPGDADRALALAAPGLVLIHPDLPGSTVGGQRDWIVADPQPTPRDLLSRYSQPAPLVPARPARVPVKPWREIADALAARLRYHAFCTDHSQQEANPDCPFCADRDAYDLYLQAGGTVRPHEHRGTAVPIHEIPFNTPSHDLNQGIE